MKLAHQTSQPDNLSTKQRALLLRAPKQRYELVHDHPLPALKAAHEVLIRIEAIGLNPIDWKSADFGFGLPTLPAVNGRDLSGIVVRKGTAVTRFEVGDKVFGPSTQYRDYRTSAFQQYAVASEFCLAAVPAGATLEQCAGIGVAVVTAFLAISSSLGIPVRGFAPRTLSVGAEGETDNWGDVVTPVKGDWILVWGGGSSTGFIATQLARLAGLRVVAVANKARNLERLKSIGVEEVVDSTEEDAAVAEVRRITDGKLRFALDCISRETATRAMESLCFDQPCELVGLSGLPKIPRSNVAVREVPVKTFHSNAAVGRALMLLVESLLESGELVVPSVEVISGGLEAINGALDRLRVGNVDFGRLVVRTMTM
ncbi:GroES-like protein [Meredithblackwellia eburnea MCA 4105]